MPIDTTSPPPSDEISADTHVSTAPESIGFDLRGLEDREEAEALAHAVGHVIRLVGEKMDLSGLDGVTIGHDYDEALASLDRGVQGLRPLSRTTGDQITGVAMAPAVLRGGVVKSHLVFWAPVLRGLTGNDDEAMWRAISIVAHECGHAAELRNRDRVLPGIVLQRPLGDFEEAFLFPPAEAILEEYAACRHSAVFGSGEMEAAYREGVARVLGRAHATAISAIRAYRVHHDLNRMLAEAGAPIAESLRVAAYLAGHIDGLGRDAIGEMWADLAADAHLAPRIVEAILAARTMWSSRDGWTSLAVFDPLKDVIRSAFANHGIFLRARPDGRMHVDVPFTAETMPL